MYCKNCGNEIADGSRFCNYCGSPVIAEAPEENDAPAAAAAAEPERPEASAAMTGGEQGTQDSDMPRKPLFEEFKWNVEEYPEPGKEAGKTEDINFDWNADPRDIPDVTPARAQNVEATTVQEAAPSAPQQPHRKRRQEQKRPRLTISGT